MSRALDKEIIAAIGGISVSTTQPVSDLAEHANNGKLFYMAGPFASFAATTKRPVFFLENPAASGKNLIVLRAQVALTGGGGAAIRAFSDGTGISFSNMGAAPITNALFGAGDVGTFSAWWPGGTAQFTEGTQRLVLTFINSNGGTVQLFSPEAPCILSPGENLLIGVYPENSTASKFGASLVLAQVDP